MCSPSLAGPGTSAAVSVHGDLTTTSAMASALPARGDVFPHQGLKATETQPV